MVERHNEILRRQLHLLEDQSNAEGLAVTFSTVLAEAVFAKNAMFQLGNATPYEAIFGRHPPLMATVSENLVKVFQTVMPTPFEDLPLVV